MRLSSHHPLYVTRKRQENMNDKTLEKKISPEISKAVTTA